MFAVVIPVGPDPRDQHRLQMLTEELAQYEDPGQVRLVVIDDAPHPRALDTGWPEQRVIRTPLWQPGPPPDTLSAHVAGTLLGLQTVRDAEFALKLDTDAAVIGSFSVPLREAFADPRLGVVGSYDRTADGGIRDWGVWEPALRRATRPFALARTGPRPRLWYRPRSQRAYVAQVRRRAAGITPTGAHCLGGAYAVSHTFLDRASLEWEPWLRTRLGEDVVVGLLCSQSGLQMRSLTAPGEVFALSWRGLPDTPERLAAAGYRILHSVKQDDPVAEEALRRRLRELAGGPTVGGVGERRR